MNVLFLVTDANTLGGLFNSYLDLGFGGDWILIGICVFALIAFFLVLTRVRAGGIVAVGAGFAYLLSLFNPAFQFIFWLAIMVSVFMLIQGLRKQTTQ